MNDSKNMENKTSKTIQSKTNQQSSSESVGSESSNPLMQMRSKMGNQGTLQLMNQNEGMTSSKSFSSIIQRIEDEEELLQGQMEEELIQGQPEEEELIQGQPEEEELIQGKNIGILQRKENKTGLPDGLKSGVESLSGVDMSDVKVHSNSSKPAEVGALAYTQGTDIHVAPGQEKHLPHEAWHVTQQKQGRVKPTTEIAGAAVNDDKSLENEATNMGEKAVQAMKNPAATQPKQMKKESSNSGDVIQGWLPLGHSEISKKVLNEGDNKEGFSEDVKKYLVDRSPDMDFMQDETTTMDGGGAEGKANIGKFYNLLGASKKGRLSFRRGKASKEDIAKARDMWQNNELHKREKWYMTHHGEGGFYKDDMSTASAKNYAVTKGLVDTAIEQYNAGKKTHGMSILSDALHQAADRGAHEEGTEFKGHDSRIGIKPNVIEKVAGDGEWPSDWKGEGKVKGKKADPDNASKNPEGAKYGLYHVNEALGRFKGGVEGDITFEEGVDSGKIDKRTSKIAGVTMTGNSNVGKLGSSLAGMGTKASKIRDVEKEEWANILETGSRPEMKSELSQEESEDVNLGLAAYDQVYIIAELVKGLQKTRPRRDNRKKSLKRINGIYDDVMSSFPDFVKTQCEDIKERLKTRALANYSHQRAGTKSEHLRDEDV